MDAKQRNETNHGGDIYTPRKMKYSDNVVDFSASINPAGMPQEVEKAITENIAAYQHYPDPLCRELRASIARAEHIPAPYIFCGNGAADLIYRIVQGIHPKSAMIVSPTFSEYEAALSTIPCSVSHYDLSAENGFELTDDILDVIPRGLGMLFLCNPNNPTGVSVEKDLIRDLAERCLKNGTVLVVDECFIGFLERQNDYGATEFLNEFNNLIILKAFTKVYAMAGIRLGYLLCRNEEIIRMVRRIGQPWNVSTVAAKCGIAALSAKKHVKLTRQLVSGNRAYLMRELRALGYHPFESGVNYILFYSDDTKLDKKLLDFGILIRPCRNFRGLDEHYYRIAVRTMKENEYLIDCLKKISPETKET